MPIETTFFYRQLDRWDKNNKSDSLLRHLNKYNYFVTQSVDNDNKKATEHYKKFLQADEKRFDSEKIYNPLRVTYTLKGSKL